MCNLFLITFGLLWACFHAYATRLSTVMYPVLGIIRMTSFLICYLAFCTRHRMYCRGFKNIIPGTVDYSAPEPRRTRFKTPGFSLHRGNVSWQRFLKLVLSVILIWTLLK